MRLMLMTDVRNLMRLMTWLSPVFPTGGFAYSSGLEAAIDMGLITNETELENWLKDQLHYGSLHNDSIFLAQSWHALKENNNIESIASLACAMAGCAERHREITAQGEAFIDGLKAWDIFQDISFTKPFVLPICVAQAAFVAKIPVDAVLTAYVQSQISNQLHAAIRLSLMGQTGAARLLARLETEIAKAVSHAQTATLDDLGTCAITAEIAAMNHEHMNARMFQS